MTNGNTGREDSTIRLAQIGREQRTFRSLKYPRVNRPNDYLIDRRIESLTRRRGAELVPRAVAADTKPDGTPVTVADRDIERILIQALTRFRPEDAVLGEELGARGSSPLRWLLDPIDGKPWDHAPAVVLVEEAGGTFSDSLGGHSVYLGEGSFTNGLIHRELDTLLAA